MQTEKSTDFQRERNRLVAIGVSAVYVAVAVVLQCCLGNIAPAWWAFPMNVAVLLVLLVAGGCLIKGIVPPAAAESALCVRLGLHDFTASWVFAFCIVLLVGNLWLVVVRRSTKAPHAWRFALNHIGVLITIVSLFFGAADTHKRHIVAQRGVPVDMGYDAAGTPHGLGYEITLDTFAIARFDNGQPAAFQADVAIDGEKHVIRVNEPLRHTWCEDIYLTDYHTTDHGEVVSCVFESVIQPWKYITLAGIVMMMCGALLLFFDGRTHKSVSKTKYDRP